MAKGPHTNLAILVGHLGNAYDEDSAEGLIRAKMSMGASLMRCTNCGGQIPWHQETLDTKSELGMYTDNFNATRTKTVQLLLCPACAHERAAIRNAIFGIALVLIFAGVAIAVVQMIL